MNEPIRVLHVLGNLNAGGAESRIMDIYRNVDRSKVQFDFAIHTNEQCFYSKEVLKLGGKIYSFPRFNGLNLIDYLFEWCNFFENHPDIDIIHGHLLATSIFYNFYAYKHKVKLRIVHSRNANSSNFIKKIFTKFSHFYATHLFAVSDLAGIYAFGKRRMKKGKVMILPNAINARIFKYNKGDRAKIRKKYGIENEIVIGHIGRFHFQKNHKFLIDIIKELYEKNNEVKLMLVGDGDLRYEIENKIKSLNIHNIVILTGIKNNIHLYLQAMDILVFPSIFEGFPGVVLEAQAAGLPCIISDTITKEVNITGLVKYVSINKSANEWVTIILDHLKGYERKDTYETIVNAGYHIVNVAKWYEKFYLKDSSKHSFI